MIDVDIASYLDQFWQNASATVNVLARQEPMVDDEKRARVLDAWKALLAFVNELSTNPDDIDVEESAIWQACQDVKGTLPQDREHPLYYVYMVAFAWCEGDELLTISKAAWLMNRKVPTISQWITRGELPSYRDPGEPNPQKARRVLRGDLVEYAEKRGWY